MTPDDPDVVRRALLLAVATGEPPAESLVAAYNRATGGTLPLSHDGLVELDVWEREQLEEFRKRYWDLPPAERRAEWQSLRDVLRMPHATRTLDRWKLALDRTTEPRESFDESNLAETLRTLFILSPRARGLKRIESLQTDAPTPATVKSLLADDPDLISLDPAYFSQWAGQVNWRALRGVFPNDAVERIVGSHPEYESFVRIGTPDKFFRDHANAPVEAVAAMPEVSRKALRDYEAWTERKVAVRNADSNDRWKYLTAIFMVVGAIFGILRATNWSGPATRTPVNTQYKADQFPKPNPFSQKFIDNVKMKEVERQELERFQKMSGRFQEKNPKQP
jgi:hypothetical protein